MSVELLEALILATQMSEELPGKTIEDCSVRDVERMQRCGLVQKDLHAFDQLVSGKVVSVTSRGNTM